MNDRPDALQLADMLNAEIVRTVSVDMLHHNAAVELRRLHEAHDWQYKIAGDRLRRIEELERINAEMYTSLLWIATVNAMDYEYQARARIALGKYSYDDSY